MAVELIVEAIRRLGFVDLISVPDCTNLPECDVVICTCSEKEDCRAVVTHYSSVGISVICAFNFGIGACAVIVSPHKELPHFVEDKADSDTFKAMLHYPSPKFYLSTIANDVN